MYKIYNKIWYGLTNYTMDFVGNPLRGAFSGCHLKKWIMRMNLIIISLCVACLQIAFAANAQRITLVKKDAPLDEVFQELRKQSGYDFVITNAQLKQTKPVTIRANREELTSVLNKCFEGQPFTYSIENKTIVVLPKKREQPPVLAPGVSLKGNVSDEKGAPISGVSVKVDGTEMGTATNTDGNYKFVLTPGKYRIIFSCIGFNTRILDNVIIEAGKTLDLNVMMKPTIAYLQETVVVGYGVQEKRSLTGSIGTYKPGEEIGQVPLTIDRALIGRIAGVQVAQSSGMPGSASAIIIRGVSTLNKNGNSPLVVIDGVPVYSLDRNNNTTDFSGGKSPGFVFGGTGVDETYANGAENKVENNPLASINPDDIESIEVLKDAYATAIYGSRGAAGVILVTTKKGKAGKMKINFTLSSSASNPVKTPSMMTGDQYADFYTSFLKAKNPQSTIAFPKGINTNWLDEVTRTAIGSKASLSLSGGNENLVYAISGGYDKDQSYIINNDFNRYQGRINLEGNFSKSIKVGANMAMSYVDNNALNTQRIYRNAILQPPNSPITDAQGNYVWRFGDNPQGVNEDTNPVAWAKTGANNRIDTRVFGNVYTDVKFAPWITWHTDFGVDWIDGKAYSREVDKLSTLEGMATSTTTNNRRWVISNELRINKLIAYKHGFNATLGQSFETSTEGINSVVGENFQSDDILSINAASTRKVINALDQKWAMVSYFGRFNYQYNNKYLAGVTYRLDGSSKFSRNKRYVGFPSFSLGWVPSEESFLESVKWIDQLKFRGSLGYTGNDGGAGYYGNQGTYRPNPYGATYGTINSFEVLFPNNPNLEWERTTMIDVGMDLSVFQSRLTLSLDYYNKKTKNSIVTSPLPNFMGFNTQLQNLADLTNKGLEVTLNSQNFVSNRFKWYTTFNIARNSNVINKLHKIDPELTARTIEYNGGRYWLPGASATSFYMYEWGGVNAQNGNPIWVDKNGNKVEKPIPSTDFENPNQHRKVLGDALPKFFGGLGNTFSYQGFELNAFFTFAQGNKLFNGARASTTNYTEGTFTGLNARNLSIEQLNYWKNAGDQTNVPGLINESNNIAMGFFGATDYTQGRYTSRFLEDASYIKLRNLTLAYTLERKIGTGLCKIKVFAEGNNLFVITKYSGMDPEVSAFGSSALNVGYDELTLPPMRSFRLGIQLGL
ncbi:TonB-dependent receptor [Pedobacter nyackensis]|uniref:TonB-dependent receptor n=1 Tax=Pedobacter nyackensis TaxID=475255 RepID=UPI00292F4795|nr:TonB-dependent receptor [Pedobacter nyackensis]